MNSSTNASGPVTLIKAAEKQAGDFMTWGLVSALILCCYTTCLCCMWNSLKTAIDVIDAAADFIRDTFVRLAISPLVHFLLSIVIFAIWVPCFFCVLSMNKIEADKTFPQLKELTWKSDIFGLAFFMVFAIIWLLIVVENLSHFVIMVATSTYYWNNQRD